MEADVNRSEGHESWHLQTADPEGGIPIWPWARYRELLTYVPLLLQE